MGGELFCALGFTFLRGEASLPSPLLWTRHSGVTVFPSARGSKNRYPAEGVSPRAGRERPSACVWRSGYWFTTWRERSDWTRTSEAKIFRAREEPKIFASAYRSLLLWTRHSGVTVFPSARGSKNRYPAEGVSPRAGRERPSACVWRSGYWFTTWRERSDWTRTSEAKIFRAREEPKIFASAYRSLLLWTRTRRSLEQAPQRLRMAEWLLVRARGTDKARIPRA